MHYVNLYKGNVCVYVYAFLYWFMPQNSYMVNSEHWMNEWNSWTTDVGAIWQINYKHTVNNRTAEICTSCIAVVTKLPTAIPNNVLQLYCMSYGVRSAFLETTGFLVIFYERQEVRQRGLPTCLPLASLKMKHPKIRMCFYTKGNKIYQDNRHHIRLYIL